MTTDFSSLMTAAAAHSSQEPGFQTVAVLTAQGNLHVFEGYAHHGQNAIGPSLITKLAETQDAAVAKLLCRWSDGTIDLPHIQLRKDLQALDPRNSETQILLQGQAGLLPRPLASTL